MNRTGADGHADAEAVGPLGRGAPDATHEPTRTMTVLDHPGRAVSLSGFFHSSLTHSIAKQVTHNPLNDNNLQEGPSKGPTWAFRAAHLGQERTQERPSEHPRNFVSRFFSIREPYSTLARKKARHPCPHPEDWACATLVWSQGDAPDTPNHTFRASQERF